MGEIFRPSVELFDTKQKEGTMVRQGQEKDNLHEIKSSLSDGLLKALGKIQNNYQSTFFNHKPMNFI